MDNNHFIVSARKYRPSTFSSVVGQKHLTATLQNAINSDRLAHSYLFCGSRGVGKTSCARIFAKTINCEHRTPQGDPCNECESCKAFNEGRSFNIIELDAASNNGVEDMRELTKQVLVPPTNGRYRVFIIDEVHMLSSAAFNAFLKTLEEPPAYIIFILATTEKHKIIPTILSRCQIYDFNRITVKDIADHLAMVAERENITADPKALAVIATQADGALRDALSIFDQIVASSGGNVTYQSVIDNLTIRDNSYFIRLADAFAASDVAEALLIFKEIREKGFNTHFFINGLQNFMRDLMAARDPRMLTLIDATDDEKSRLKEVAEKFQPDFFYMALSLINDADMKYREASNKTFLTELLLIKLCQLLSPSPVFKGQEEGHLDSLSPLGAFARPAAPDPSSTAKPQAQQPPAAPAPSDKPATHEPQKAAPRPQRTASLRPTGLKIMSLKKSNEAQPTAGTSVAERHDAEPSAEFSAEELKAAWDDYAASVPEKKMLVNLMMTHSPEMRENADGSTVFLTLSSELQKEIIDNDDMLLAELRKKLSAPNLRLVVEVKDSGIAPRMWSDREILDHIIELHPEAGKFISDLNLSLT